MDTQKEIEKLKAQQQETDKALDMLEDEIKKLKEEQYGDDKSC